MRRVIAALALALALAGSARAETVTIRLVSELGPSPPLTDWMNGIMADSGGAVVFQTFWGGQVVSNPTKEYDAMINGVSDASIIVTAYVQQQFPDFGLFAIPFVVKNSEEAAVGGWGLYEKGMIRGLDKLHVAAIYSNDVAGVHLAKDIHSLDELKGLKIRVSGPLEAQITTLLGGVPLGMPLPETAQALTLGTYQGTLNGWGANGAWRFTPLLKAHVEAPLGVRIFFLALTRAVYDRLPPAGKAAVDKNSGRALSIRFGKLSDDSGAAERKAAIEAKQTIIAPDEAALHTLFHPLLERWIASTPDGQAKLDALEQILAQYRKGS